MPAREFEEKALSILDADSIDSIGIDARKAEVVLTIDDPLDWSDPKAHILALQAKFNAYMAFIQAGRIAVQMPEADGLRPHIAVYLSHEPPERERDILESIGRFAVQRKIGFSYGRGPGQG